LKRCLRATMGLVVLLGLGSGCGSGPPEPPASKVDLNQVGGNRRLKEPEDAYKKLIGKDGRYQIKPGMKNPNLRKP
jgi:hypothetical protein